MHVVCDCIYKSGSVIQILSTLALTQPLDIMANNVSLQDQFYPIRTSLPSCILLPEPSENHFELKPQFINTLPRFHGLESEDAYSSFESLKKYV